MLFEELQDCMRLGTSPVCKECSPAPFFFLPVRMTKGFQPLIEDDARSLGTRNKR